VFLANSVRFPLPTAKLGKENAQVPFFLRKHLPVFNPKKKEFQNPFRKGKQVKKAIFKFNGY